MASNKSKHIPVHGNYHGYYTKRPSVNDPRLTLLPKDVFRDARVLDIGCNEGWVTCDIAQSWGAKRVVGVDIDDALVRAAWKRRRTVWSLQEPSVGAETSEQESSGKKRKREHPQDDAGSHELQGDYFPASFEHMFGPLPIPSSAPLGPGLTTDTTSEFPHNVVFVAADWVAKEIPEDAESYDVVLAFSISKWIHLNQGDEGLMRFFTRVYSVLRQGGKFILEPQDWDTYSKAKRLDPKLKENAQGLMLRPDDFERILQELGFGPATHLGSTGEGGFRRPVDVYEKIT